MAAAPWHGVTTRSPMPTFTKPTESGRRAHADGSAEPCSGLPGAHAEVTLEIEVDASGASARMLKEFMERGSLTTRDWRTSRFAAIHRWNGGRTLDASKKELGTIAVSHGI